MAARSRAIATFQSADPIGTCEGAAGCLAVQALRAAGEARGALCPSPNTNSASADTAACRQDPGARWCPLGAGRRTRPSPPPFWRLPAGALGIATLPSISQQQIERVQACRRTQKRPARAAVREGARGNCAQGGRGGPPGARPLEHGAWWEASVMPAPSPLQQEQPNHRRRLPPPARRQHPPALPPRPSQAAPAPSPARRRTAWRGPC